MQVMNPIEAALRALDNWKGWTFPAPDRDKIPVAPWHPDGDKAFTMPPKKKHPDSDKIMDHIKNSGPFHVGTGSTVPDYAGKTGGALLNVASAKDKVYTISKNPNSRSLWVKTGYRAPYGAKVRIGNHFVAQGYPMREYSDHKMHIFDPIDRTVTEIQFVEDIKLNPVLNFLLGLFGGGGGYACHGVKQYSIDLPSTDPRVEGSSAARIPMIGTALRYADLMAGHRQITGMAVPASAKSKFVAPARATDGPSTDPYAVQQGMFLRLKPEASERLLTDPEVGPQSKAVIECYGLGAVVLDTSGTINIGVDLDPRWDQNDLSALSKIKIDDFEVWTL